MSLKRSNLFFRLPVSILILFICSFPIYSLCIAPFKNCKYNQIGADSWAVSCFDNGDTTFSDTIFSDIISKSGQLQEMKREFDSSTYCFLGIVDSVIKFRSAPSGSPCKRYDVDSVHVKINTVYKGQSLKDYWFLDTLAYQPCDTNTFIWIEDPDPGYDSVKGTYFIAFTDVYGSLRTSNVTTSGCSGPIGYFIDKDSNIIKRGTFWSSKLYTLSDNKPVWVKTPLNEFIGMIEGPQQVYNVKQESAVSHLIDVVQSKNTLKIRSFAEQFLTVAMYSLNGKMLFSTTRQFCAGFTSVSFDKRILSSGICIAKICTAEAVKTLRINTW